MACDVLVDEFGVSFFCTRGLRESRKRCAFCENRATSLCDGERCVKPICDAHACR
jgi:hypothetical protein